jgi:internalin A
MKGEQQLAVEVFCSYAQEDELFRQQLEVHLKVLEQQGLILLWHDRQILPGLNVIETRNANLKRASIILLLVSAYFIAAMR